MNMFGNWKKAEVETRWLKSLKSDKNRRIIGQEQMSLYPWILIFKKSRDSRACKCVSEKCVWLKLNIGTTDCSILLQSFKIKSRPFKTQVSTFQTNVHQIFRSSCARFQTWRTNRNLNIKQGLITSSFIRFPTFKHRRSNPSFTVSECAVLFIPCTRVPLWHC